MKKPNLSSPSEAMPASQASRPADPGTLPLEVAFADLEAIVAALESPEAPPLEEALALYERGMLLSARCARELARVEGRIQAITREADGTLKAADLDTVQAGGEG